MTIEIKCYNCEEYLKVEIPHVIRPGHAGYLKCKCGDGVQVFVTQNGSLSIDSYEGD